jgi:signal transduction histidine kinase
MGKLMGFQLLLVFFFNLIVIFAMGGTSIESATKMILMYLVIASIGVVILDFVLSPDLKRFVIKGSKDEDSYTFNYEKRPFKNLIFFKITPLIILTIIAISFFGYAIVIRENGNNNFRHYQNEMLYLNLDGLGLDRIINQLRDVPKLNEESDFFFYGLDTENLFTENNEEVTLFFREYINFFRELTDGRIYDSYGIERGGYVTTVTTDSGEVFYIGFSFTTSDLVVFNTYLVVFVLIIVLAIIYLRVFAKNITSDISAVSYNLNSIANNKDHVLIEKIPISSNDEIGEIVGAYNKIQQLNQNFITDLNVAKEQAELANNYKTDFLSSMSHEIRTPLNAIVGFSQSLQDDPLMPESAKEEVKDIVMASHILLEIVNGILDISKIEANKLEIVNSEYDPYQMFKELTSLALARMGDKPLEFKTNFDPSIPKILYGDHSRIKQIVLNLLTNAVKYTKEGHVEFKVHGIIRGDICRLVITVEDSGSGIKPDDINKLFNKFERLNEGGTSSTEGTGLGLAITKKLTELMGGQIIVHSVWGQGSKFSAVINQKIVTESTEPKEQKLINTQEIKSVDLSNKRVLVVDDNKLNLKVATRLLSTFGLEIVTVDSGYECLSKINSGEVYDLILMDDMMPIMSGVETFHKLKENPKFNIPTVALTANALSGMKEKYIADGFDDYISKPIERAELNRVIKKFLDK